MQIPFIPIIHARTSDVDFRSNLLVVPDFFTIEDTKWCRTYIIESTRFFEVAGNNGRKVLFSNDNYIVIGTSIYIQRLYELCRQEPKYHLVDGTRTNYAFIGFLFRKSDISQPFDIPYSLYLQQYERYMELRWNDSGTAKESLNASRVTFHTLDFPIAKENGAAFSFDFPQNKTILNSKEFSADSIIAGILRNIGSKSNISFCSDLPNAVSFIDSHFMIGTSLHADRIQERLNQVTTKPDPVVVEEQLFEPSPAYTWVAPWSMPPFQYEAQPVEDSLPQPKTVWEEIQAVSQSNSSMSTYQQLSSLLNASQSMEDSRERHGFNLSCRIKRPASLEKDAKESTNCIGSKDLRYGDGETKRGRFKNKKGW